MRRLEGSDKSRAQLGSDVTLPHTTHAGPKVERYLAIKQPCPSIASSHQNKVRGCHSKRKAASRHVLCLVRGSKCSHSKLGRRHVARLPFAQFQPPTQSERVFAVNCPVWGQVNDVPTAFGDRSLWLRLTVPRRVSEFPEGPCWRGCWHGAGWVSFNCAALGCVGEWILKRYQVTCDRYLIWYRYVSCLFSRVMVHL